MAGLILCRDGRRLPNSVMAMGVMEESSSKSLEKLLAKQKIKEIAAEDYDCKIETWLRLADQMLTPQHGQKPKSRARWGPR
jgi:hypothetical protein